jgi:hypothetical protein
LSTPAGPITDKLDIQEHVYSFYRELMGMEVPPLLTLVEGIRAENQRVSSDENLDMALSFSPRN